MHGLEFLSKYVWPCVLLCLQSKKRDWSISYAEKISAHIFFSSQAKFFWMTVSYPWGTHKTHFVPGFVTSRRERRVPSSADREGAWELSVSMTQKEGIWLVDSRKEFALHTLHCPAPVRKQPHLSLSCFFGKYQSSELTNIQLRETKSQVSLIKMYVGRYIPSLVILWTSSASFLFMGSTSNLL